MSRSAAIDSDCPAGLPNNTHMCRANSLARALQRDTWEADTGKQDTKQFAVWQSLGQANHGPDLHPWTSVCAATGTTIPGHQQDGR
jgi:hypothetical protein